MSSVASARRAFAVSMGKAVRVGSSRSRRTGGLGNRRINSALLSGCTSRRSLASTTRARLGLGASGNSAAYCRGGRGRWPQGRVCQYAAPAPLFFPGAPISAMPPDSATEKPNWSLPEQPGLTNSARSRQALPERVNS
jgi:hypothetical protein